MYFIFQRFRKAIIEVFGLFKKTAQKKDASKKEKAPKLNPTYDQFVSNQEVAKLKIAIIKSISEVVETIESISDNERKIIIGSIINKIPSRIKTAYLDNKKTVYLFGSSIGADTRKYGGSENAFRVIAADLYAILSDMGTNPTLGADKSYISFNIDDLKEFCNYDKLLALK